MTYSEISKSEDDVKLPVPTQTASLDAPSSSPSDIVHLEKAEDRFHMVISKAGCSATSCLVGAVFFCFFAPIFAFVSASVATEDPIWYVGLVLALFVMVFGPCAMYRSLNTEWAILVEAGHIKLIETYRQKSKERVWAVGDVAQVEVFRRTRSKHRRTKDQTRIMITMSEDTPFLERYVPIGLNDNRLDDDTLDWMAREIARFVQVPVIIPSYPSISNGCS